MSREPKRLGALGTVIMVLVILGIIAATGLVVWKCIDMVNLKPENAPSTEQSVAMPAETQAPTTEMPTETTVPPTTTEPPEPEKVVATATISAQGDLLMHKPVFDTCRQKDGTYNFESIFRYSKDLVASYDYAIANLETTFGGDKYVYQGNPAFNCPDALAANAAEVGYDMFLTSNNHSGDTMGDGIIRTLEVSQEAGLATLGSQKPGEKRYSIVEVNGIKIGMVSYTWAFSGDGSKFSLNGLNAVKDEGQMNYFTKANPDKLYKEVEPIMEEMKAEGAEATMMFLHWGEEYDLRENAAQQKMAQKLCDMGFDVIVGGHAHVVQPMALLESTVDPEHKTVCIYSVGNAVSNQRNGYVKNAPPYYTEDGVLFEVTFEKYSDGKVYVVGTDVIPTWVNMHTTGGVKEYNILPLQDSTRESWRENFNLNDNTMGFAERSYDRTMGIVGEGLEACQEYLAQAKEEREAYYYDLAFNTEKVATAENVPEETTAAAQAAFDTGWASNEFEALLPELPFSGWTTKQSGDTVYEMELGGLNTSAAFNGSDSNEPDGADHDKLVAYLDSLTAYGFQVEVTESLPDFPYEWLVTDRSGNTIEVKCAEGYCWITIHKTN